MRNLGTVRLPHSHRRPERIAQRRSVGQREPNAKPLGEPDCQLLPKRTAYRDSHVGPYFRPHLEPNGWTDLGSYLRSNFGSYRWPIQLSFEKPYCWTFQLSVVQPYGITECCSVGQHLS